MPRCWVGGGQRVEGHSRRAAHPWLAATWGICVPGLWAGVRLPQLKKIPWKGSFQTIVEQPHGPLPARVGEEEP